MNEAWAVLVIEDDPDVRLGCEQALQLEGFNVIALPDTSRVNETLVRHCVGTVVSDIRLPGKDGMSLFRELRASMPDLPVILMTGHGDVSLAVQAMKEGVYDFIEKPFASDHLVEVTRRALQQYRLSQEVRDLRAQLVDRDRIEGRLIGHSAGMAKVRKLVFDLANSAADILIEGETGTGKEQVARCLHDFGPRRSGPFVAINCGGMPDSLIDSEIFGHEAGAYTGASKRRIGKIEYAKGGTLFLDEIESMPMAMQIKLLRVIQERSLERLGSNIAIPVDCRIVAATKSDLNVLSAQGGFRADLYYRLNVVTLPLPPLRDRREDIPLLMEHFVLMAAHKHERPAVPVSAQQMHALLAYDWPGNVRELRNVAERHVLGMSLLSSHGSASATMGTGTTSLSDAVATFERTLIEAALGRTQGNLSRAAQELGIAKATLHDKVKKYRLGNE